MLRTLTPVRVDVNKCGPCPLSALPSPPTHTHTHAHTHTHTHTNTNTPGPCALNVDFNQLTASTASQPDKFKIIKAVVSTTKALGGLQTITCACEQVVRAFEAAVDDAAVAKDIASQLNTIRIINQLPDTLPENKSLTFGGGIITYAGVFPVCNVLARRGATWRARVCAGRGAPRGCCCCC